MNMVSSSRIGGRRQVAAWGWGRLSRREREGQGGRKESSVMQRACIPCNMGWWRGRGLRTGPKLSGRPQRPEHKSDLRRPQREAQADAGNGCIPAATAACENHANLVAVVRLHYHVGTDGFCSFASPYTDKRIRQQRCTGTRVSVQVRFELGVKTASITFYPDVLV
jgi:hypothetical protein